MFLCASSYSSVLGDAFHYMDRPKVPVRHSSKKAYFVALRRAWFMFEPKAYAALKDKLRLDGLTDKEIETKEYYEFAYFRKRVPRYVPPPEQHYHRVRAVYALYGSQPDATTGLPLFNKAAWKKACNVLGEILMGYAADPPGVEFYYQSLNAKGEPAFDEHGIPLLDCNRGTNGVENTHKQIVTTFGTWCTGAEMADCLLAERRHRYNHNMSERRRHGFPKIGHYDTWLIDLLQVWWRKTTACSCYPPGPTLPTTLTPRRCSARSPSTRPSWTQRSRPSSSTSEEVHVGPEVPVPLHGDASPPAACSR